MTIRLFFVFFHLILSVIISNRFTLVCVLAIIGANPVLLDASPNNLQKSNSYHAIQTLPLPDRATVKENQQKALEQNKKPVSGIFVDAKRMEKFSDQRKKIAIIVAGGGAFNPGDPFSYTTNFPRFYQFGLSVWHASIYKFGYLPENVYFAYTDGKDARADSYNTGEGSSYYSTLELPVFDRTKSLIDGFKARVKTWDGKIESVDASFLKEQNASYASVLRGAFEAQELKPRNYSSQNFSYNNNEYRSPIPIVTHSSSLKDLRQILSEVAEKVESEPGHSVFFYLLGHGLVIRPGVSVFSGEGGDSLLADDFLRKAFSKIAANAPVLVSIASCYSGKFLPLSELENVAVSVSSSSSTIAQFKSGIGQEGVVDQKELTGLLTDFVDHMAINYNRKPDNGLPLVQGRIDTFFEHYMATHYNSRENFSQSSLDYLVMRHKDKKAYIDDYYASNDDSPKSFNSYRINDFHRDMKSFTEKFNKKSLIARIERLKGKLEKQKTVADSSESAGRLAVLKFIKAETAYISDVQENFIKSFYDENSSEKYLDLSRFLSNKSILKKALSETGTTGTCRRAIEKFGGNITTHAISICRSRVTIAKTVSPLEKRLYSDNIIFIKKSAQIKLGQLYDVLRLSDYADFAETASHLEIEQFLKKLKLMQTPL